MSLCVNCSQWVLYECKETPSHSAINLNRFKLEAEAVSFPTMKLIFGDALSFSAIKLNIEISCKYILHIVATEKKYQVSRSMRKLLYEL